MILKWLILFCALSASAQVAQLPLPIVSSKKASGVANLITNPGFESFTGTADDATTDSFTGWSRAAGGGASYSEASTTLHGGVVGLRMHRDSSSDTISQIVVGLTASTNYRLTFWARGNGSVAGRFAVRDHINAEADIVALKSTGVTAASYALVTEDFTTPAGCTEISLVLLNSVGANVDCWWDDFSLVLN